MQTTVVIWIVIQCGSVLWKKWNPGLNCHIIMFFGMVWSHFPRAHYLLPLAIIILGCITTGKSTRFHLQQDRSNLDPNACSAKTALQASKNCQKKIT